jgi:outer membrane lipoprotein
MMMKRLIRTSSLILLTSFVLSACTTIPEQLNGDYSVLTPDKTAEKDLQTQIRWGGIILETRPEDSYTCFEILSKELEKSMRPGNDDQSFGRFIACKPGFYDPEVFEKEREVTVVGKIIHMDVRKVGDFDYNFPVVDIEFMSLWPKRRTRNHYYGPYYPYYWHYGGQFRYRYPY